MVNIHSPSTILPPTALRDIVAFIFILYYLPNSVNSVILVLYILSGSTKFIGGQLIIKYVNLKFKFERHSLDASNLHYVSKLFVLFSQVLVINSIILWALFKAFPSLNVKHLTTLSKSILACELIGSSSLRNSSTITSVVASTPNPALLNASSSDLAANHNTTTTTTTSIKKSNAHIKINKVILDNNFLKVLFCFAVVISINYIINNYLVALDYHFIVHCIKANDMGSVFSHRVFKSADSMFHGSKFAFIAHSWLGYNRSPLSRKVVKLINYIYINLCVHVITLKISPLLKKTILLKNYSNNLDHLSNLTPVVPIDFKRNNLLHDASSKDEELSLIHESLHDELPIISLKEEEPDEELVEVKLAPKISGSDVVVRNIVPTSISIKNFEIFCITPFKHQLSNLNINSSLNMYFKSKFDNSKFKPNSTMIIDRNLSFVTLIQPFWSLLAACKTMIKDPGSFNGNATIYKNKGGRFLVDSQEYTHTQTRLMVSVKLIHDTIIVLKVLSQYDLAGLRVRLNGLDWQHFQVCEEDKENPLIKIFSLSPYFQYEIELLDGDELARYLVVNTVSSSYNTVLSQSPMVTPLMTLQSSLISTIEELNQVRSNFKKFKKEENKKQADYKRDNDILVKKIEKLDSNNDNNAKKLENLKQIINQYENEIKEIEQKLDFQSNNESYEIKKSRILDEIEKVNVYVKDCEEYFMKLKREVKHMEDELNQINGKGSKLESKKEFKTRELHQLDADINALKKGGFLAKINKRYKKINEKYETILPRIRSAVNEISKIED